MPEESPAPEKREECRFFERIKEKKKEDFVEVKSEKGIERERKGGKVREAGDCAWRE